MSLDRTVAHFVTHRRRFVFLVAGLITGLCIATILFALRFDSDVLDLLPRQFDSVQALKVSDREFTNARQLTFAVCDTSGAQDAFMLDTAAEKFRDALKQQPWAVRVTSAP